MGVREVIKGMVMKMFNIQPTHNNAITIMEPLSYDMTVLRNQLWYRGDASELDQFFKRSATDSVGRGKFWAAVPSADASIRKYHSGLPGEIIDKLTGIILSDMTGITVNNAQDLWDAIELDNKFSGDVLGDAIKDTLITGDGAFKISIDTEIADYPIIEFVSGRALSYVYNRGRLQSVKFYTQYIHEKKVYTLHEIYGKGFIKYELYNDKGLVVRLSTVPETAGLEDVTYMGGFIMAVPLKFFKSPKFDGRGTSVFERKTDNFDALDEVISQWIDAIRAGRVKNYIPEALIPKHSDNGGVMKPNPFDNQFIKVGTSMKEDAKDQITQVQAEINYSAFVESYASMLDMCLQGIISPSTLGIDLKKTDNAEAQREKEKATLYTRSQIVDVLSDVVPLTVATALMVYDNMKNVKPKEYDAAVTFGEYSSPDFGSVVETVGKAKSFGVMSVEQAIEELYNDKWTDEQKALEVKRIRQDDMIVNDYSLGIDGMDDYGDTGDIRTDGAGLDSEPEAEPEQ